MNNTQNISTVVDNLLNQIMESQELAGMAVGIVKDGETMYAKGFGVKNSESKEPITESSLFHLASVSKTFTTTAVMQLVEQGLIQLDSTVVEYLPYFRVDDERYSQITIRQLLTHCGGLPRGETYWDEPDFQQSDAYFHVLGEVFVQSGDIPQAIESLQRCLALNPSHPHAQDMLNKLSN
ncbi:MAG: serine hydrolase [Chloroflexota bacterium]